jgi:cob(I)alamin adenosyltransferase
LVVLNKIYTRTGDKGTTALATGSRRAKHDLRVAAYGTVDETNACIGLARLHTSLEDAEVDGMLGRIQNDMFDLGADLATPETGEPLPYEPLRITQAQVDRLEREIDALNGELSMKVLVPVKRVSTTTSRSASSPTARASTSPTSRCR